MPIFGPTVVVVHQGRVLLQLREDTRTWCLPGGAVEAGESLAQAAVREVKEETGLDVVLEGVVGVYSKPRWRRGSRPWTCGLSPYALLGRQRFPTRGGTRSVHRIVD